MTVIGRINKRWGGRRLLLAAGLVAGPAALQPAAIPVSADYCNVSVSGTCAVSTGDVDIVGTRQEVTSAGQDYVIKTDAPGAPEGVPEAVLYYEKTCHVSVDGTCVPPPTNVPANSCPDANCSLTCQQRPSTNTCTDYDPHEMNCDNQVSNPGYHGNTWDNYDQIYLKIWLRWSSSCQSNWSKAELDNAFSSDYVAVAMGYDPGPPPGSGQQPNYDVNTTGQSTSNTDSCNSNGRCTDGTYGNMLFGGSGTHCTTAYAWVDQTNPVNWWYTRCV